MPLMPSIKLNKLMYQATVSAKIQTPTMPEAISTEKRVMEKRGNSKTNATPTNRCNDNRTSERTWPWSSQKPTAATNNAPQQTTANALTDELLVSFKTSKIAASATITMAKPPPRGVGKVCEDRSPGVSKRPRRKA